MTSKSQTQKDMIDALKNKILNQTAAVPNPGLNTATNNSLFSQQLKNAALNKVEKIDVKVSVREDTEAVKLFLSGVCLTEVEKHLSIHSITYSAKDSNAILKSNPKQHTKYINISGMLYIIDKVEDFFKIFLDTPEIFELAFSKSSVNIARGHIVSINSWEIENGFDIGLRFEATVGVLNDQELV